jgi:energy-coupling factor transport system ATP-binding protein
MIEIQNVTFNYSAQGEQDVSPALENVSLRIEPGETIAIIGHNGSGKSTLMKLIAAILQPQSGTIRVDGLSTSSTGQDIWTIREYVGIVFQNPDDQLIAGTVIDDIAFGPENLGLPLPELEKRVHEAIELLGLEKYAQMAISELSVSLKQRVAIAGILAMRPRYLLLDEPTTMISGHTARQLLAMVQRLAHEQNIAVVHITHFMHEITAFDRVIVMDAGHILMDGTPTEIFAQATQLKSVGLDVPLVTQLGNRLHTQGWTHLPPTLLSPEQLRTALETTPIAGKGADSSCTDPLQGKGPLIPTPHNSPHHLPEEGPLIPPLHSSPHPLSNEVSQSRNASLFELKDVYYTHQRGTPFEVKALHGLSLAIPAGQITALIGPTGSGKSTVIDLLAALVKPEAGSVLFEGRNTKESTFNSDTLRSQVGVVFQSPESQIFEETVGKDISFGPRLQRVSLAESRRRVQASLEAVGLSYEDFRSRYTYALSGGEKRRVAIAGVLALEPKVIIFDEPMAGLDPRGRADLLQLIITLKQRSDLTIVYASSSLVDIIELADTLHVLDGGRLAFNGTPHEILHRANELYKMDIELPEAAQIALALRSSLPAIRTDVLDLTELEAAIQEREERSI